MLKSSIDLDSMGYLLSIFQLKIAKINNEVEFYHRSCQPNQQTNENLKHYHRIIGIACHGLLPKDH